MEAVNVGLLHPGEMGVSVGAALRDSGHNVYWAAAGRSPATRARARQCGLNELQTLDQLCRRSQVIVCVCPPIWSIEIAEKVRECRFTGLYLDANAMLPQRAQALGELMVAGGADFVDGGIIGPPAWQPGTTRLFLSGKRAGDVAALFETGPLATQNLGDPIGLASAIKICDSAFNKGVLAVLYETLAIAERLGVRQALQSHWGRDLGSAASVSMANDRLSRSAMKAWRFAGEMKEVSEMLEASGLPDGFFRSSQEIFARLARFQPAAQPPSVEAIVSAILEPQRADPR